MSEFMIGASVGRLRFFAVLNADTFSLRAALPLDSTVDRLTEVHRHSDYEMFLVEHGAFSLAAEGQTFTCESGWVLIPPLTEHVRGGEAHGYTFHFTVEPSPGISSTVYEKFVKRLERVCVLPLSDMAKTIAKALRQCLKGERPSEEEEHWVHLFFSELCLQTLEQPAEQLPPFSDKRASYINAIETYIYRHNAEKIHLADVANELFLCTKEISRIIKRAYGCTFTELVTDRRLSCACTLLKHSNLSVGAIARHVGFRDKENYFYHLFRKRFGMTPSAYRAATVPKS